jgi:hypothetical protein
MNFLAYLYWLRVPLVTFGLVGIGLPLAFHTPLFRGLADLAPGELKWASMQAFLLVGSAVATANLILMYGRVRMLGKPLPTTINPPWRWLTLIGGLIPYITLLVSLRNFQVMQPEPMKLYVFVWYALLGFLMAVILILFVTILQMWFAAPAPGMPPGPFLIIPFDSIRSLGGKTGLLGRLHQATSPWDLPGASRLSRRVSAGAQMLLSKGYFENIGGTVVLLPGILFALFILLCLVTTYVLAGISAQNLLAQPFDLFRRSRWLPTVFWVMLGMSLVCWFLSAAAYWLDRYRVPVSAVLALYLLIVSWFPGHADIDHYYDTVQPQNASVPLTDENALSLSRGFPAF